MNPVVVLVGLIAVLLAALVGVLVATTGLGLAWGVVILLLVLIVGLLFAFVAFLPRWPG